jgi:signal peptidase I
MAWLGLVALVRLPPSPLLVVLGFSAAPCAFLAAALHAGLAARRADPGYALRPFNRWYVYVAAAVLLALWQTASVRLATRSVAEAFRVASPTMWPTLYTGDRVLVAKLPPRIRSPRPGTVVVFRSIEAGTPDLHVVKRVIGTAGDTLRMAHDTVYRNGVPLDEPYAAHSEGGTVPEEILERIRAWQRPYYAGPQGAAYHPTPSDWGPIVVPVDSCFVLGDNRGESWDSRFYGFVPTGNIEGAPRIVYFSRDSAGGVRWGRIGRGVR